MSGGSIGTIVGGIVGAVVGFFTPLGAWNGAQLGMMVGGGIGTALDPPKGPNNTGPRLGDLTVQTSTYGATIPRLYGTVAVFGNIFWLENNRLKEVARTESSGGKGMGMMGGGGGETTTYSYYATFALGLCEGPIIGIRRIWIGPKLFYDVGSNDWSTLKESNRRAKTFRIYLGTDDQLPDTRMQAALGAVNVPAYRGLAYIVFDDFPLADYGNTLIGAQIKCEVVGSGNATYKFEERDAISTGETSTHALAVRSKGDYAYVVGDRWLHVYNIIDKTDIILVNDEIVSTNDAKDIATDDRYLYVLSNPDSYLRIFDISNPANPLLTSETLLGSDWRKKITLNGVYAYITYDDGYFEVWDISHPDALLKQTTIAVHPESSPYVYPIAVIVHGDFGYMCVYGVDKLQVYDLSVPSSPVLLSEVDTQSGPRGFAVSGNYAYVTGGTMFLEVFNVSDPNNMFLVASIAVTDIVIAGQTKYLGIRDGYLFIAVYGSMIAYSLANPEMPVYVGEINVANTASGLVVNDRGIFWISQPTFRVFDFYAPVISPLGLSLSDIVEAECLRGNLLNSDDIDVTSLTPIVRGYRVSEVGAIRAGIEPLRAAWPFDVVMHGYQIKFVLRGTSSVATITEDELDARDAGAQPGVQITISREMDYILPRKVSIKHFDVNREYDTGDQPFERINTDSVNVLDIELPIVLTAREAAQKAEVLLYLYWMERYDIAFNLPQDYSELEPGDVIAIITEDATYELRLTSIVYTAAGRLECKAKYNSAALYNPAATGEEGQSTGVTLQERGDTLAVLLDIPLLQDVYDKPGYPVAMTGYLAGWPGGILYRSDDGGQSWQAIQGFTPPGATIGYAVNTLAVHGGTVLDKSGLLTVRLYQGELASVTEAQLFAGQNWFAYGADGRWEIIGAQNCVLQGDGSYILSDFLRGQMGTEWATGLHQNRDFIVYLNSASLTFVDVNQSSIGAERLYRAVTGGEQLDSADDVAWVYGGVNLECLSPCHLTGSRHPGTKDWTITFVRRTRFAGWRNYVDAPLGEASESYEMDIFADGTYATLKRTLTSTSPSFAYTSAQQTTDFGAAQETLFVKIYQLSATVGRGYPLTSSLTRILSDTKLLLHFNGSNGSTTFTDSSLSGHTIAAVGNAQISTAQSKFGGSSGVFDGAGDSLTVTADTELLIGTKDFTIEFWVRMNATGVQYQLVDFMPASTIGYYIAIYKTTANKVAFWVNNANRILGTTSLAANTWYHVAVSRVSGVTRLFVDGIQDGPDYNDANNYLLQGDRPVIGGSGQVPGVLSLNGYLDELRIMVGKGMYSANFTPPTSEFDP
jgi:hypothetical protein